MPTTGLEMHRDDNEESRYRPQSWRPIEEDQVVLVGTAFLMAHLTCAEAVQVTREGSSLVCWCELCQDLSTYQVVTVGRDI